MTLDECYIEKASDFKYWVDAGRIKMWGEYVDILSQEHLPGVQTVYFCCPRCDRRCRKLFLIDDVEVIKHESGGDVSALQNGTFETDTVGEAANAWRLIGNHSGRRRSVHDEGTRAAHSQTVRVGARPECTVGAIQRTCRGELECTQHRLECSYKPW